jgi:hypothetical protein
MEAFNFTTASEDCNLYTYDMRKLDTAACVHKVRGACWGRGACGETGGQAVGLGFLVLGFSWTLVALNQGSRGWGECFAAAPVHVFHVCEGGDAPSGMCARACLQCVSAKAHAYEY